MSISLSTFLAQLTNMVPEADTELKAIIRNQLIKQAVMDYSRDRPDTATSDVSGDGGKYYPITNLTAWSDEFSRISAIQYPAPAVASDETPVYLDPEDWDEDYYAGGVRYLWLPHHAPAATETMRVTYAAAYAWSAGSTTTAVEQTGHGFSVDGYVYQNASSVWVTAGDTANLLATHQVTAVSDSDNFTATELVVSVPEIDFFAVCNRAACLVCRSISELYSRTSDSTINADSVQHTTRAGEFANRANEFCRLYSEHLGQIGDGDGKEEVGHAEFVDLDTTPLYPSGRDYLFKGRHTR
jgi:hypothetical protein